MISSPSLAVVMRTITHAVGRRMDRVWGYLYVGLVFVHVRLWCGWVWKWHPRRFRKMARKLSARATISFFVYPPQLRRPLMSWTKAVQKSSGSLDRLMSGNLQSCWLSSFFVLLATTRGGSGTSRARSFTFATTTTTTTAFLSSLITTSTTATIVHLLIAASANPFGSSLSFLPLPGKVQRPPFQRQRQQSSLVFPTTHTFAATTKRNLYDDQFRSDTDTATTSSDNNRNNNNSNSNKKKMKNVLSLVDFLKQTKEAAASASRRLTHIAIGNEAGDADSLVSAIAHAYIASTTTTRHYHHDDDENKANQDQDWITPVLSIPRNDLQTQRPETTLLLRLAGLDEDKLDSYFVDVNDLLSLSSSSLSSSCSSSESTLVTLLDHNFLSDQFLSSSSWKVVEILDHHMDTASHLDTCPPHDNDEANQLHPRPPRRRIAFDKDSSTALVASTCTLVAEGWFQQTHTKQQQQQQPQQLPSPEVALLLLGTILLDSVNMSPAAGKGTERDGYAIQQLLQRTDWSHLAQTSASSIIRMKTVNNNTKQAEQVQPDTTKLFDALQNAKFDVDFWRGLSVRDALRLDYKAFVVPLSSSNQDDDDNNNSPGGMALGFSSVLMPWKEFCLKPNVWKDLRQYMVQETQVRVLVVMFTYTISNDDNDNGKNEDQDNPSSSSSSSLQRELLLCGPSNDDDSLFTALVHDLLLLDKSNDDNGDAQKLQLVEQPLDDDDDNNKSSTDETMAVRLFRQGNSKASRKQVAPILIRLLSEKGGNK